MSTLAFNPEKQLSTNQSIEMSHDELTEPINYNIL